MQILGIFLLVLGFAATKAALEPLGRLLFNSGITKKNYREDTIPTSLGLVFLLTLPLSLACLTLRRAFFIPGEIYILLFFITGMGLLGLCDDVLKTDEEKGFRGHFAQLLKGNLTSGGLKALAGLVFGLIFTSGLRVINQTGWLMIIPQTLVAALSANSMNLFDLRPGRAVKFFFFLSILILLIFEFRGANRNYLVFLYPVTGGLFAYLPVDIRAQGMLGDTGANFLGALLGGIIVLSKDHLLIWLFLIILVGLQLFAEKYSISQVIENNNFLRFLDRLGRE